MKESREEKVIVVAHRLNDASKLAVGSKVYYCQECREEVWLAPSSQKWVEEGAKIICICCFPKKDVGVEDIADPTDEQREEMQKVLGYEPGHIDRRQLVDYLRELGRYSEG